MTVTLAFWMIPVALTLAIWVAAILWPVPARRGDYDFTGPLVVLAHFVACVVATLVIWLVYFAVLAFGG